MANEWFRLPDWTPEAQEEFERRLKRARSTSRPQYLTIKGGALLRAGETEGARQLWHRVVDDPEASWVNRAPATEHLADSYRQDAPERAAALYRSLDVLTPTDSCTTATQWVKLAQVLLDHGTADDLPEVERLLRGWLEQKKSPFPVAHFWWALAFIDWAQATGDKEAVQWGARYGLDLIDADDPFPRHPGLGQVRTDPETIQRLQSLVASD